MQTTHETTQTVEVLCIGAGEHLADSIQTALADHEQSYAVSTDERRVLSAVDSADADCVVAVHDPPTANAKEVLDGLARDIQVPVVVYAVQSSETLAMEAVNSGVSQYVKAGTEDPGRLADAVADAVRGELALGSDPEFGLGLADVVDQFPTAAFVLNEDHEVVYWNEACAELLEYDSEQVCGTKRPYEAFYTESRPVMADLVLEEASPAEISEWYDDWYESPALEGVLVAEDYFPRQDIWLRFSAAPLRDAQGTVRGAIETLEEITERKKHQTELERYETIVEASGDPVYTLDADGCFTYVNDEVTEITGYEEETLLGSHVSSVVSARDVAKTDRRIRQLLDGDDHRVTVEMDVLTAEGDRRRCETHIALLPFEEEFRGTVGVVRDITDRKEHERELRRFKNAVEYAGHAVSITDNDGTITYVNPAFEEMTGYSAAEALGENIQMLRSANDDGTFFDQFGEVTLEDGVWEGEVVNERKSGERFVARETVAPIRDPDGEVRECVSIQDEITSRRLREQQLKVFHRVLRHNLRNKGTAIKGHADVLEQSLDESQLDSLQTIQDNVQSLIDVSEKAHHVRQVVANALEEESDRDLETVLAGLSDRVQASHPDADVQFRADLDQSFAIDGKSTHALHELLDNAVRHSNAETPRVEVGVQTDGRMAHIQIADNGDGIPEGERQVIEAGTEGPLEHSSGLGLWFAHWLVHYVGGNIDISVDEDGTTVTVTLPVK